jgi:predicted CopG family antitoxin
VRNITISVDDELYRLARIKAAEKGTTVSGMVRVYLQRETAGDVDAESLRRERNEVIAKIRNAHPNFSAADRLPRDELYKRR